MTSTELMSDRHRLDCMPGSLRSSWLLVNSLAVRFWDHRCRSGTLALPFMISIFSRSRFRDNDHRTSRIVQRMPLSRCCWKRLSCQTSSL